MNLFRNPEIKIQIKKYFLMTILLFFIGLFISVSCALYTLLVCAINEILFLFFTKKRYKYISDLNFQLDELVHGKKNPNFIVMNKEGELAILSNEIYKLTIEFRHQVSELEKQKKYLNDFIADISHQIRTPMTSLRMLTTKITKEQSFENRFNLKKDIVILLSRVDWLVTSLLKVAQLESDTINFESENIQVSDIIDKVLEILAIPIELKKLNIKFEIMNDASFKGDFYWSLEALQNIIKNCIDHSYNKGEILIKATENSMFTEIAIMDNGKGISKKDLPHIFERFYRGENSKKDSMGIGLFLSKMIISRQNGMITAKNRKEKGASFFIKFYKDS